MSSWFLGFTSFSNIFGITSFAWALVNHARLYIQGDGVFGFHQGRFEGGRGFVCYFDFTVSGYMIISIYVKLSMIYCILLIERLLSDV